jgi:tetratricopeptide (TPR) repeat protein
MESDTCFRASPWAMNIDPDLPVFSPGSSVPLPEAFLLAALLAAGIFGLKRRSMAGFGIFWFFLHLLPTNSFIPRLDVANDRQLYLASWGLFMAAASEVDRLAGKWGPRRITAVATALVLALGALTVSRNMAYRSEVALWEDTVGKSPGKGRAWNNLGYAYQQAGRLREAEASYLRALRIDPGYALALGNLKGLGALPGSD